MTKNPTLQSPTPFPVLDPCLFDWEEGEDVYGLIRQLVDGTHPGLLTTVDSEGRPHVRWMASLSIDAVPRIYTLTSAGSRKVAQIEKHPEVSWMFCNSDLSLILNLDGKAKVMRDVKTVKHIWGEIQSKAQAYFLQSGMEGLGMAVIETQLEHIECCTPKSAFRFSVEVDRIRRLTEGEAAFQKTDRP